MNLNKIGYYSDKGFSEIPSEFRRRKFRRVPACSVKGDPAGGEAFPHGHAPRVAQPTILILAQIAPRRRDYAP